MEGRRPRRPKAVSQIGCADLGLGGPRPSTSFDQERVTLNPVLDDLAGYTGKAGETFRIQASDDFEVAGVEVRITDSNGETVEQGVAARGGLNGSDWQYNATKDLTVGQTVSIEVTATDRPGHKTTKTKARA